MSTGKVILDFNVNIPLNLEFPLADGRTLVQGPLTYNSDGLATQHNCDFIRDPLFAEAYRLGISTGHRFGANLHVEWRVFVCCWAAHQATHLNGDFVECGVNTGILSRAIMHYIGFENMPERKFWLLDTFQGIPEELLTHEEKRIGVQKQNVAYFDCYELVKKTFSRFSNAVIIRGRVPDTLVEVSSERVCYLSIDMNSVIPEIAAGEYFWDRLVPGAVVVLDDYGWSPHINQKIAWDKFADKRGVKILALPTGQGLIIKP